MRSLRSARRLPLKFAMIFCIGAVFLGISGTAQAATFNEPADYKFVPLSYQNPITKATVNTRFDWNLAGGAENIPYFVHNDVIAAGYLPAVQNAFNTIQNDPTSDISFIYEGPTATLSELTSPTAQAKDAVNVVSFRPLAGNRAGLGGLNLNFWFDGAGNQSGVAHFDISISSNTNFSVGKAAGAFPGATDLETVVLHELGHALGLDHPATNQAVVMYPVIDENTTRQALHPADALALNTLYPTAPVTATAQILDPVPATKLCNKTLNLGVFHGTDGTLAPGSWWVTVGTTDEPTLYASQATSGTYAPTTIGLTGKDVVVRVWYLQPGGVFADWVVADAATYQTCSPQPLATANGAMICDGFAIDWALPTEGNWWITAGTDGDLIGLYSKSLGSFTGDVGTATLGSVPAASVHVKLWHQPLGGTYADWRVHEARTYKTCHASLTSSSVVPCDSFPVDYDLSVDGDWWLTVGTSADLLGLHSAPIDASTGSIIIDGLPSGSTVFAKLWHRPTGGVYNDWRVNTAAEWTTCTVG